MVFGDNRPTNTYANYPPEVFYTVVNEMDAANLIATIGLGDHVGYGYESQYAVFYDIMNSTRLENIWLLMGNHEVVYPQGWTYWRQYIGPEYYITDSIPGWRLALLNTESSLESWNNQLNQAVAELNGRVLILFMHRPVYPNVNHNLQSDKNASIHEWANTYGWPPLVVQAHWHGWAYYRFNNTDWVIAGSTGAPLYKISDCQSEATCVSAYHYMWLILYPNQTYSFKPVLATNGTFSVRVLNETAYIATNNKLDVYGNPVEIPVRVKYTIGGTDVYIVAMIPANTTIVFNINPAENYLVQTNATEFYVYFTKEDDYNATIILPENELSLASYNVTGEIELYESVTLTSPTPTTTTTTTTKPSTTTTTTTTSTTTTTTTSTTTTQTTEPATTTPPTTTTTTVTSTETTTNATFTTTSLTITTETIISTPTPQATTAATLTTQPSVGGDMIQIAIVMGIVLAGVGVGLFTILKKR
ncbi:metallophosphoesterase [Thermosphaera chiliense]|uniref:Metallophosphoesterase n=1 Tax=Thermosphaera chiliense TaxID=3402707 RepID=A0A7M1UNY5_9CREN|nr:metallophosphoesterase family protein [Thermosphaera aggregans]QOR93978.1 metallophosphoesterase [Thermosphaera aggregans]